MVWIFTDIINGDFNYTYIVAKIIQYFLSATQQRHPYPPHLHALLASRLLFTTTSHVYIWDYLVKFYNL